MANAHLPYEAEIVERIDETRDIFTLRLRFTDIEQQSSYRFQPGQFNMVYLHGAGEVAISIVSDPDQADYYAHTIRAVGRVTRGLAKLAVGDRIGIRGPYGRGWPLQAIQDQDLVLLTGGLGCAPVVSVIHHVMQNRSRYRRVLIMQGVKHSADLLWKQRYQQWARVADTQVLLAADQAGPSWPGHVGMITTLFNKAEWALDEANVFMCGPEIMMLVASRELQPRGVQADKIWISMERNMQCAIGQCGHCQYGPHFVCKDGPVFNYESVQALFGKRGF